MKYQPMSEVSGPFRILKYNTRLYIACEDILVYTAPDFLRLDSRQQLQELADRANTRGQLVIEDVIVFESRIKRPRNYSQRTCSLEWGSL